MAELRPGEAPDDEFDVPLGGLPSVGRMSFADRSHMQVSTAEVRFATEAGQLTHEVAAAIWQRLGGSGVYPTFEAGSMQTHSAVLAPDGVQTSAQVVSGWRLGSADASHVLLLFPGMLAIHALTYERYSADLGEPLRAALAAVGEAGLARPVNRIGLRYVNRLSDERANTPAFWRQQVCPAFAGALLDDTLADRARGIQQMSEFDLGSSAAARVVSGVFEDETALDSRYGFIVDIDVFRTDAVAFDVDRVSNLARQLNRTALALFVRVLSEDAQVERGRAQGEEVDS